MDNEDIYSVGKKLVKQTQLFAKQNLLRVLHELALLTRQMRN